MSSTAAGAPTSADPLIIRTPRAPNLRTRASRIGQGLPGKDTGLLVDPLVGQPVRWVAGRGWVGTTE